MNKKEYNFDLILTNKQIKDNHNKISNRNELIKTKLKLKNWVKVLILLIIGSIIGISIYQLFTLKTTKATPVGNYTCYGGIIEICKGNNNVADYLGV